MFCESAADRLTIQVNSEGLDQAIPGADDLLAGRLLRKAGPAAQSSTAAPEARRIRDLKSEECMAGTGKAQG